jgi:hypothetical protein
MNMMALVAGVGEFYILFFQMVRHGNGFNHLFTPGLDLGIVAPQAQGGDFRIFFHRQGSDFFIVCHMIGIGAVAEFTGDGLMPAGFMNFRLMGMTVETGFIGPVPDGCQGCFSNGIGTVRAIHAKRIREQKLPDQETAPCQHNQTQQYE